MQHTQKSHRLNTSEASILGSHIHEPLLVRKSTKIQ